MLDVKEDAKGDYRRAEILTRPGRRRRWSFEEKSRIIEESLAPGALVSEVARRWQVCPQLVFGWRRAARQDVAVAAVTTTGSSPFGFVPIVADSTSPTPVSGAVLAASVIEVALAGAVVRVVSGQADGAQLAVVLRAVRASASGA